MEKVKVSNFVVSNPAGSEKERGNKTADNVSFSSKLVKSLSKYTIVWIVILTGVILSLLNSNFATTSNFMTVLRESSFVGIGGIGMTFVIMGGGIDLSVPGVVALTAVVAALLVPAAGLVVGLLLALVCGVLLGAINGLVITKLKITPFVATLGTGFVYLAIVYIITNQQVIPVSSPAIINLGIGSIAGIPIPFILLVLCTLFCAGLTKYTRYGRFVKAVGSKKEATLLAGVPVNKVIIFSFMVLGLMFALTGVSLSGYLSTANGNMGTNYDLQSIAVAVVGGTSLQGGKGSYIGTLAGAIFFAMISNALDLFGVASYWQYVATGLVIVFAITLDGLKTRKSRAV